MATDLYQAKYEHLLMDPNQLDASSNVSAKQAELKALIVLAGDSATTHAFPAGNVLGAALTGNTNPTTLTCFAGSKHFTNDILLRVVSTVGATPTVTINIQGAPDAATFANCKYALIATPNTFVTTAITITTAVTNVYRIPAFPTQKLNAIKLVVTANTNVTLTTDVIDFGGVPL